MQTVMNRTFNIALLKGITGIYLSSQNINSFSDSVDTMWVTISVIIVFVVPFRFYYTVGNEFIDLDHFYKHLEWSKIKFSFKRQEDTFSKMAYFQRPLYSD